MRKAFIDALVAIARDDPKVVLLTADLGYCALEPFQQAFPGRYFNVGVAEQNMVGMATGLAEAGWLPFVYSIAPFAALRPYELIRNGPVYHRLPVRVVAMGMGFEYGHAGPSHFCLEDVGVMRSLGAMTVVVPADGAQAASALHATWDRPGPVYYSLGKDGKLSVEGLEGRFDVGRAQTVRRGGDVVLLGMGSVASELVPAAQALEKDGIAATVAVVSSFCPDPGDDVLVLLQEARLAVTVEAHRPSGGLGSFVATVAARNNVDVTVVPLAVDGPLEGSGDSQKGMWRRYGLHAEGIAGTVREALRS